MRIEPLHFRSFEPDKAGAVIAAKRHSPYHGKKKEEAAPPAPPPAPTYSEEDIKAAEMKGYQRGFLEGMEEGKKQAQSEQSDINQQLIETTSRFASSIKPLIDDYGHMIQQLREDMPRVALAISKKIATAALDQHAEKIISDMALSCAQTMLGEPKLSISVHPSLADALKEKLQALAVKTQTATHFVVLREESMAASDCRIEWKYGAMERHTGALWQEVERVVDNMIASAARDTKIQLEPLEQESLKE